LPLFTMRQTEPNEPKWSEASGGTLKWTYPATARKDRLQHLVRKARTKSARPK